MSEQNMPKQTAGDLAKRGNVPVWFEIPAADLARAAKFYEQVFDLQLKREQIGDAQLAIFPYRSPQGTTGCIAAGADFTPGGQGSLLYLNADPELDPVLQRVAAAGGRIVTPRTALPPGMGYFASFIDSEGNRVGVHALA